MSKFHPHCHRQLAPSPPPSKECSHQQSFPPSGRQTLKKSPAQTMESDLASFDEAWQGPGYSKHSEARGCWFWKVFLLDLDSLSVPCDRAKLEDSQHRISQVGYTVRVLVPGSKGHPVWKNQWPLLSIMKKRKRNTRWKERVKANHAFFPTAWGWPTACTRQWGE